MKQSLVRRVVKLKQALTVPVQRPCTLFLVEVAPGEPTGWRDLGAGIGAELRFTQGTTPPLPNYPVKLVLGPPWDV